jgi:hypothetical protein
MSIERRRCGRYIQRPYDSVTDFHIPSLILAGVLTTFPKLPMINRYPPEIWRAIMDNADQLTLREVSLVCNAFRDISQSLIFKRFIWSDTSMTNTALPNPMMPISVKSHADLLYKTSCITSSHRILSFIRELSFVFVVPSETPEYHETFTLWRAVLPKMHLTTFTFAGIVLPESMHQPLREQQTLRTLVSPSLTGCRLPCYFRPRHSRTRGSLLGLELVNTFGDRYDPRYGFIGPRPCTTLTDLIFEHIHTLVRLRLDAQMLYEALIGIDFVPNIPQLATLRIDEPPAAPDTPLTLTFAFVDAFANFAAENTSVKELVWMYHSGVVILPLRLSPEAFPNLQRFSGVGVAAPSFTICAKVSSFELEFRAVIPLPPLPVAPRNANTTEEILETLEALKRSAPSTHSLEIALPHFDHEIFPAIMCFTALRKLILTGPLGSENNEVGSCISIL